MSVRYISKISKGILSSSNIVAKFPGMRKEQEFVVYPHKPEQKEIVIQSGTRIGKVDLSTGDVVLSAPRASGAYFINLAYRDKCQFFKLGVVDLSHIWEYEGYHA